MVGGKRLVVLIPGNIWSHLLGVVYCADGPNFGDTRGGVEWVLKEGMVEWVVFVGSFMVSLEAKA